MRTFPIGIRTVVCAATLVLASGCGGSETPTAAEDEKAAKRIVLTANDLPGFQTEPLAADAGPSPLDRCVNGNPVLVGENPRGVEGDDLTKDDGDIRVQSGAVFAVREAEAGKAFSDLRSALVSQCLKDAMKETFVSGAEPGVVVRNVTVTPLPAGKAGIESASARVTVALERGRERASVHVDLTVLRHGRAVAGVFTFQMQQPFADRERLRLTQLVAGRMTGNGSK